jgi:hypothetical protein
VYHDVFTSSGSQVEEISVEEMFVVGSTLKILRLESCPHLMTVSAVEESQLPCFVTAVEDKESTIAVSHSPLFDLSSIDYLLVLFYLLELLNRFNE